MIRCFFCDSASDRRFFKLCILLQMPITSAKASYCLRFRRAVKKDRPFFEKDRPFFEDQLFMDFKVNMCDTCSILSGYCLCLYVDVQWSHKKCVLSVLYVIMINHREGHVYSMTICFLCNNVLVCLCL